ncbi:MAG: gliding motility-associated C-terminal domain-containing protein [Chitinophagaceae bacterium]|jgi:gliding motility-associated-like protein|nr:gliding motility-associated C-terminal domain-containing protein [Chitinophagaceae bacterium]
MKKFVITFCSALSCLLLFNITGKAQCSGNVLFAENFGGSPATPLTGTRLAPGITTYSFDSLGLINDGEYGIRKTTADIATGNSQYPSWHVGTDRSGGNMMIVNADFTAGKFYETRVSNLCSGSQLYFSAWAANLIRLGSNDPLDPVLRFEISSAVSGTVLANFITPAIPRFSSFTWTQYGFNFSLPAGENSVILRIFNNQPGGQGNDLCLDDIEFTLCGPAINPVVTGTYQNNNTTCTGTSVSFAGNAASGFYLNPTYQWQFNNGTGWADIPAAITPNYTINNAQVNNSGSYRLLVAESGNINSTNCRAVSPLIPLTVFAPVTPVLQSNQPVCERDTLRISTTTSALQYAWRKGAMNFSIDNDTLQLLNAAVTDGGTYSVDIITNGGCNSSGSIPVAVRSNQLQRTVPLDTLLCDAEILAVNAQQPLATMYLWNDGSTAPLRMLSDARTYSLLTSDGVCKRTDSFTITRNFTPSVTLGNDTTLCFNEPLTLVATHPLAEAYLWSNNSTDSTISVTAAGTYTVAVGNTCGVAIDDIVIDFKDCADIIFVPNAFTPNKDRLNDVLFAKAFFQVDEFKFNIYNRWGQMVFSTNSVLTGWNGNINNQQAPTGLYTWTIQYKRNNKVYNQKGTVLLIH